MTDYSRIHNMIKEFNPYQTFWITTKNWFNYKQIWYHGKWELLDADKCERFIEDAVKSFSTQSQDFLKTKDLIKLTKFV